MKKKMIAVISEVIILMVAAGSICQIAFKDVQG